MPSPTISADTRRLSRPPSTTCRRLAQATTATRCYCLGIGLFLLIRGTSTITTGASYRLPGDGWRAILQLTLAALLLAAISSRTRARNAVIAVGVIYAGQTLLGLHRHNILGIIPVDTRDHIVHPALAILALIALAAKPLTQNFHHEHPGIPDRARDREDNAADSPVEPAA
jgi:hypothetical protein